MVECVQERRRAGLNHSDEVSPELTLDGVEWSNPLLHSTLVES